MTDPRQTALYQKIIALTIPVSASSLEKLFAVTRYREITKGTNLVNQGRVCNTIFFVEQGYLRMFIEKDGVEINTDFIFENNFTTSLKSLRQSVPSDTTIQAAENCIIYEFDKEGLLNLYKESVEIESFGRKVLEELLIAQEEHTNLFKIFSPAERYHYLRENRPEIIQRVSLSQISSYLGVARETLSRIRKIK